MKNIYVGNLSFRMNDDELREIFEPFGEVTSAKIVMDRDTGRSRGFGFVEMTNDNEALEAIQKLDGQDMGGRNVTVNEAKPREERPRRSGW
jgi:RNA recognition motif-containing protein